MTEHLDASKKAVGGRSQLEWSRLNDGNVSVRNYLYWSTMLGVFSQFLVVREVFAIRLFDLIMLTNLLLMSFFINYFRISKWILLFLLTLVLSGSIAIANGTDTMSQIAKEFLGISVSLLYYYYFFRLIRHDFARAFVAYTRIAYKFVLVAFPLWMFACITAHGYERLRGLTQEPAAFCELVLPAYYWYASQYFSSRKHGAEVAAFTLAIVLSGSSLGYMSVAFGTILLLSGRKKHLIGIPVVVSALLGLAYATSDAFRIRVDDTAMAVSSGDVTGVNFSTYALISNVFVTQQVLKESPLIGNGLGSHLISHARFLGSIPGVESFIEAGSEDLNAPDAASFTLRVLSEFGISGYLGILSFLFFFHVGRSGPSAAISNALLTYFFLKLVRGGTYFQPEQFFFVFVYMYNHRHFKREVQTVTRRVSFTAV